MAAASVGRTAGLRLLILLAAVSSSYTGAEAAQCGPQPTTVFVQKGEKRMVSFWHHPDPAPATGEVEPGSGDRLDTAELGQVAAEPQLAEEAEKAAGDLPAPTAAAAMETTPLIVTPADPEAETPLPLYDQQPHIILPEAPPLPGDGGATDSLVADAVTESGWQRPVQADKSSVEEGEEVSHTDGEAAAEADSKPVVAQNENDGGSATHSQGTSASDINAENDKADSSGLALSDVDELFIVPTEEIASYSPGGNAFSFTIEGSGDVSLDSNGDSFGSSASTVFNDGGFSVSAIEASVEGSGDLAMDSSLEVAEGSGEESLVVPEVASDDPAAGSDHPSEDALSAVVDRIQTLVIRDHQEADGLESDELLPLVQTHTSVQQLLAALQTDDADTGSGGGDDGADLELSASEPVAVVVAAPPALALEEAERERLLVVKGLVEDRVILENVPDPAETGSGAGPELDSDEGVPVGPPKLVSSQEAVSEIGTVAADGEPTGHTAVEGSGSPAGEEAEDDRQHMESHVIKAVIDAVSATTDNYGLNYERENIKSGIRNDQKPAYSPSAYRYIQTHNSPNYAVPHVQPVWRGYPRQGDVSYELPDSSASPLRPYPHAPSRTARPAPVWGESPFHRGRHQAPPAAGHVYFPGQFRRGGRPGERRDIYRPASGGIYATRPFKFNARESIRHQDEDLFRFLQSQPYPFISALTHSRAPLRRKRDVRPLTVDCEWRLETEPHLYLLVTLHNLSAPLTVDCSGAYIEVERENDGFEARWCGDRVREKGSRPHLVFARGEVRIAVHSAEQAGLPTGFDAEVEVIDLLDARQYITFRRSGLNFRRLIQEPVLPVT